MKRITWLELKRACALMGLYGIYYLFIGLILSIIFSTNPKEYIHQLGQQQWAFYIALMGGIISLYLFASTYLSIGATAILEQEYKQYRNLAISFLELLVQGVWVILPMELLRHVGWFRTQERNSLLFCIIFWIALATFRRMRMKTVDGAL